MLTQDWRQLFAHRADARGKTRHLPGRSVLVNDALLGGAHDQRFRSGEGRRSCGLVSAGDRFFDLAGGKCASVRDGRLWRTAVRRAIFRTAFLAELVLAICVSFERRPSAPRNAK